MVGPNIDSGTCAWVGTRPTTPLARTAAPPEAGRPTRRAPRVERVGRVVQLRRVRRLARSEPGLRLRTCWTRRTTRLCPHSRDANDAPCPNGRTPSPVELRGSLLGTCPTEAQVGEPTFGPTSSSCPASPKPRTLFAPCERLRVGVHRPVDHRGSEVTPAWLLDTTSGRSGSRTCDDHPRRIWSILHQSPPGRPSSPRGSHAEPGSATLRAGDDPTPTRAAPVGTSTWASEDPTPTCAPCGDHRDCG